MGNSIMATTDIMATMCTMGTMCTMDIMDITEVGSKKLTFF